jgi:hypothetical protein
MLPFADALRPSESVVAMGQIVSAFVQRAQWFWIPVYAQQSAIRPPQHVCNPRSIEPVQNCSD